MSESCSKCGTPVVEEGAYCANCGTHLESILKSDLASNTPGTKSSTHDLDVVESSYSVLGTHTAWFSNKPAGTFFFFRDTGGMMGQKKQCSLSFEEFLKSSNNIFLSKKDGVWIVYGHLKFSDGHVVYKCGDVPSELFLQTIFKWSIGLNLSPNIYFPAQLTPGNAAILSAALFPAGSSGPFPEGEIAEAVKNNLATECIYPICVAVADDRTHFSGLGLVGGAEMPTIKVVTRASDSTLTLLLKNRILISGATFNEIELLLPSSDFSEFLLAEFKFASSSDDSSIEVADNSTGGLLAKIEVEGFVDGYKLENCECDSELNPHSLILHLFNDRQRQIEFSFEKTGVAIEGALASFLVSDSRNSMVRITAKSESFQNAVMQNRLVRSIAYRSANCGPYIASTDDGEIVRLDLESDSVRLTNAAKSTTISSQGIDPPELVFEEGRYRLCFNSMRLNAQLPMLEGIAAGIGGRKALPFVERNLNDAVTTLLGLEGEYFTYVIFGQIADTHLSLSKAFNMSSFEDISSLKSEYERNLFLVCMINSVGSLARNIETTLHHFPSFAVARDEDFFSSAELQGSVNRKNTEQAYQTALSSSTSLLSHLYRIESSTFRLTSLRSAVASSSGMGKFIPAGISAVVGFFNPFAWAGTAQQAVSLFNSHISQESKEREIQGDVFSSCASEWDYIINTLLPAVAYRMAANIYPIRLASSGMILQAYEKADVEGRKKVISAVANRLARLRTFMDFPTDSGDNCRRSESVKFLLQIQKNVESNQYRYF